MGRQTQSGMPRLIASLKKLRENVYYRNFLAEYEDGHLYLIHPNDAVFEATQINERSFLTDLFYDLTEWLVSDNGYHHVPNRETLQRLGYRFVKGDEDAQGPLTGIIVVDDFRILYSCLPHAD